MQAIKLPANLTPEQISSFRDAFSIFDKGYAILVEGYMDVISLVKNGIENVVAGLGTAFSVDHIKQLFLITDKIIICLDEDAWDDALKLYHELNGGRLYNKIKIIKPPKDMDVADLRGQIDEYYYEIK
jgi:DNA primase